MKTLDELMTDEPQPGMWQSLGETAARNARNTLRAELREPYRALRESHDRLLAAATAMVAAIEDIRLSAREVNVLRAAIEAATGGGQ